MKFRLRQVAPVGAIVATAALAGCVNVPPPPPTTSTVPVAASTIRVSVASDGSQGNGGSGGTQSSDNPYRNAISGSGRYVAFTSTSTNFNPGDGTAADVFIHDTVTGSTMNASNAQGADQAALSSDGNYIAFRSQSPFDASDTNRDDDVFVRNRTTGAIERISVSTAGAQANGTSSWPSLSADGRYVAFASAASNLVQGDTNGRADIFIRDRVDHTTVLASTAMPPTNTSASPAISANGRFVAYQSGGSTTAGIFVYDREDGTTDLASVSSTGVPGNGVIRWPSISDDGRYVAFESTSSVLGGDNDGTYYDVFVHDRSTGSTVQVPSGVGNYHSFNAAISGNGRYVAFSTSAPLVAADTNFGTGYDVYVWDRTTGALERDSVSSAGAQANGDSVDGVLDTTGRHVAFRSAATNLVAGDTNGQADVFLRDRGA